MLYLIRLRSNMNRSYVALDMVKIPHIHHYVTCVENKVFNPSKKLSSLFFGPLFVLLHVIDKIFQAEC